MYISRLREKAYFEETEVTGLHGLTVIASAGANRSWIYFAIAALVCVLAAEAVCIAFLTQRMLAARRMKKAEKEKDGTSLSGFALSPFVLAGGVIWASEVWLIVLCVLALAGTVALAALSLVCHLKGYLFVPISAARGGKDPVKSELPARAEAFFAQTAEEEPDDTERFIAAFAEAPVPEGETAEPEEAIEETVAEKATETTISAETTPAPADEDPFAEDKPDGEADGESDDESDGDPDADDESDDDSERNDPDHFTGNERIIGFDDETGCYVVARYRKSFEAKLIQSQSHIKKYYSEIKNALLSYKGTKSRMSWTADSFHNGRAQIAKINVKTRILELYLALDPATLDGTVYRGQDVGALRKYEETPFRYKIRTPRKFKWALELIARVCEEHGLTPIDIERVNYAKQYPFDTIDNLVDRKLVKVTTRLEKPATSFELDEEQPAERTEETGNAIPASANLSWKYSDETEKPIEVEQLSVDMFLTEDAEAPVEPEPEPETVRITQIRYAEHEGENGEPVYETDRIVTDAPDGAVVEEAPTEENEPEAEAAFAGIAEAEPFGKPTEEESDPLAAAFGEAHPENLWSEETSEREADRMNSEGNFAPDEEALAAPIYKEREPKREEYTEESLSAEDYREDELGIGNLFAPDEEPSMTFETDGDEPIDDEPTENGETTEYGEPEEPDKLLAREEPFYADPQYEEVRIEDLPTEKAPRVEYEAPRSAEPAQERQPSYYAPPAFEQPARAERQASFAPTRDEQQPAYGQPSQSERQPSYAPQKEEPRDRAPAQSPKKKQIDPNLAIVDVALLDLNFRDGDLVNLEILRRRGLVLPTATKLKVRSGSGKMRRALTVVANQFTYDALLAIGGAGGETQFIR